MKCPGQDTQFWGYGSIFESTCPDCGTTVEFFKDDTMRTCSGCGKRLANPKLDFGCASYCQFADACLGSLPPELLAEKRNLIKERVAVEVKRRCGKDFSRIGRAASLARISEKMVQERANVDMASLVCAATLSVLTVEDAQDVLQGIGAPKGLVEEVLGLLKGEQQGDGAALLKEAQALLDKETFKS